MGKSGPHTSMEISPETVAALTEMRDLRAKIILILAKPETDSRRYQFIRQILEKMDDLTEHISGVRPPAI
jgi:hypothetical protein